MTDINQRLNELEITVPEAAAPVANYLAAIVVDDTLYISGQLPMKNGTLKYKGQAGSDVELADATRAAELCAINVIAQIKAACSADFSKFAQLSEESG